MRTATLNTSLPAMRDVHRHPAGRVALEADRHADRAIQHVLVGAVGVQVGGDDARARPPAFSTTAPAPSPNRIAVPRSVQSTIRESVSAPTTSAHFASPSLTNLSAIDSA